MKCSICGEPNEVWADGGYGNNAQPINDGRCCNRCYMLVVIPRRLTNMYNDYPFEEIEPAVEEHLRNGCAVFQKFTCEHCGQRLTIPENGVLYKSASCDQCNHITQIKACNYILVKSLWDLEMSPKEIQKVVDNIQTRGEGHEKHSRP